MSEFVQYRSFSGTIEDVLHWVRHMEMEAASAGLDDQQLLYITCARLTSAAASWLDTWSINLTKCSSFRLSPWAEFRRAVINRFGEQPELVANKMYNCKQTRDENVANKSDHLQRLATLLNAAQSPMPSSTLLRLSIEGLHSDIRASVNVKRQMHIEQAIEDARYFQKKFSSTCPSQPCMLLSITSKTELIRMKVQAACNRGPTKTERARKTNGNSLHNIPGTKDMAPMWI